MSTTQVLIPYRAASPVGFKPGQSGNPGGRPPGIARYVRELVGDDGKAIADFMFSIMNDPTMKTVDRLTAARWLADRSFGRSPELVELRLDREAEARQAGNDRLSREIATLPTQDLDRVLRGYMAELPALGESEPEAASDQE